MNTIHMTKIVSCMCVTVKVSCIFINKKSLMFKYGRTQRKFPPQLVCDSFGACLDCVLPGIQVTTKAGIFSAFKSFKL